MISKAQKRAVKNAETLESFVNALPVRKFMFEGPLRIQMELFNYFKEEFEDVVVQVTGIENKKLLFRAGVVYNLSQEDLLNKLGWLSRVIILHLAYSKRSKKC